jgi:hypothetical protein
MCSAVLSCEVFLTLGKTTRTMINDYDIHLLARYITSDLAGLYISTARSGFLIRHYSRDSETGPEWY